MGYILFGVWALLTGIMFYCCKRHNEGVTVEWIKATWEPYIFSAGVGVLIIALIN